MSSKSKIATALDAVFKAEQRELAAQKELNEMRRKLGALETQLTEANGISLSARDLLGEKIRARTDESQIIAAHGGQHYTIRLRPDGPLTIELAQVFE